MTYLCYFIFLLTGLRLLVALFNYLTKRYLPKKTALSHAPFVSILIPARNEEQKLPALLDDLQTFRYENLEIIIYNDNSTDQTLNIAKQYAARSENIKIIEGKNLPKGWLGKNHACHRLAMEAEGEMLLFLDADVRVRDGLIERSLSHFHRHQLQLLSVFPQQEVKTRGEKISVPLMNWILLSLLPLLFVRTSKKASFSAANGQFMLFNTKSYKRIRPHQLYKLHKVEDIAINGYYKREKLKVDTLLGDDDIKCRMYENLHEAVEGFAKNMFQFFGNSIPLTLLFGLITTIAPFIIFYQCGLFAGICYLLSVLLIRTFISLASKQHVWENIILMIPQHIIFLYIIVRAISKHNKKELEWKGRNIL